MAERNGRKEDNACGVSLLENHVAMKLGMQLCEALVNTQCDNLVRWPANSLT